MQERFVKSLWNQPPAIHWTTRKPRLMKRTHILLIEANRLRREGLTAMLKEHPDFKVVASPVNSVGVTQARKWNPSVILLDLGLCNPNSLGLLASLKRNVPDARVIGMDFVPMQEEIVQYVEAGVCGFVLKDATLDDFLRTIRSVAKGESVLPPLLTGSLFSQIVEHATRKTKGNLFASVRMTSRERDVILLITEGLSNKEIVQRLALSLHTVKAHLNRIFSKLNVTSRSKLMTLAMEGPLARSAG